MATLQAMARAKLVQEEGAEKKADCVNVQRFWNGAVSYIYLPHLFEIYLTLNLPQLVGSDFRRFPPFDRFSAILLARSLRRVIRTPKFCTEAHCSA
jgi:hypothetical protein